MKWSIILLNFRLFLKVASAGFTLKCDRGCEIFGKRKCGEVNKLFYKCQCECEPGEECIRSYCKPKPTQHTAWYHRPSWDQPPPKESDHHDGLDNKLGEKMVSAFKKISSWFGKIKEATKTAIKTTTTAKAMTTKATKTTELPTSARTQPTTTTATPTTKTPTTEAPTTQTEILTTTTAVPKVVSDMCTDFLKVMALSSEPRVEGLYRKYCDTSDQ